MIFLADVCTTGNPGLLVQAITPPSVLVLGDVVELVIRGAGFGNATSVVSVTGTGGASYSVICKSHASINSFALMVSMRAVACMPCA